jgi:hypothetical protein
VKVFQLLSDGSACLVPLFGVYREGDFWRHCDGIVFNRNMGVSRRVVPDTDVCKV